MRYGCSLPFACAARFKHLRSEALSGHVVDLCRKLRAIDGALSATVPKGMPPLAVAEAVRLRECMLAASEGLRQKWAPLVLDRRLASFRAGLAVSMFPLDQRGQLLPTPDDEVLLDRLVTLGPGVFDEAEVVGVLAFGAGNWALADLVQAEQLASHLQCYAARLELSGTFLPTSVSDTETSTWRMDNHNIVGSLAGMCDLLPKLGKLVADAKGVEYAEEWRVLQGLHAAAESLVKEPQHHGLSPHAYTHAYTRMHTLWACGVVCQCPAASDISG